MMLEDDYVDLPIDEEWELRIDDCPLEGLHYELEFEELNQLLIFTTNILALADLDYEDEDSVVSCDALSVCSDAAKEIEDILMNVKVNARRI